MSTTAEKIAVMQAFERGEKIQYSPKYANTWKMSTNPLWDWHNYEYKIAPKEPRKFVRYFFCDIKTGLPCSTGPYLDVNAAKVVCNGWNRTAGGIVYEVVAFEMMEIVNRD